MNILVVSQYFWPETFIINELTQCLVANGHTVEVLTGKPNYPDGKIFEGYSATGCSRDSYCNNIVVHRVPLRPRGRGGKQLIRNYFSFILNGLFHFNRLVKNKEFDFILVYVPSPITSVIPAIYLKWKLKTHLAVWVQDLWPESVKATGFINHPAILKVIGKLVKKIYQFSDTLLVQSQAFIEPMMRYTCQNKIIYYPNSYLELKAQENEQIPDALLEVLENETCFVFAGNLGTAQSLETVIEAAKKLKSLPHCKIILIGSGSMSRWLEEQIQKEKLHNVLLPGRFEASLMPSVFARAAGLLVTLKREEIFSYTIPSKVQAYLAAGRPIIAALDGEGARIIEEAGAGLVSPAEDADALAKNIEQLYHMPSLERGALGKAGRAYFLEHFEMTKQSQRLVEILKDRIKQKEKA
nr:glycosyltransferase [Legionella jordanis]